MAEKKQRLRTFTVNAWIQVQVGIPIEAADMEDAAKKAKELDVEEFISMNGDCNDARKPRISWISEDNSDPDDD